MPCILKSARDSADAFMLAEARTHADAMVNNTSYFTGQLVQAGGYLFREGVMDLERQINYMQKIVRPGPCSRPLFIILPGLRTINKAIEPDALDSGPLEELLREKQGLTHKYKDDERILIMVPSASPRNLRVRLVEAGAGGWEQRTWIRM